MKKTLITMVPCVAVLIGMFEAKGSSLADSLPAPVSDQDYYENGRPAAAKVELGRLLFFDKILSGNRNISCATCHHPLHATSDGLSLPFGEGPKGLGPDRGPGKSTEEAVHTRIPRNSPALFNKGAKEFVRMFHDGRVELDVKGYYEGGFITPAKWKLPKGLDNALAAQAMFPVTSPDEMAGHKGENDVANAISLSRAAGPKGAWALLSKRLAAIPEYVSLFKSAFPAEIESGNGIRFTYAANAIAAFQTTAFRSDRSPFDQYLRGERSSLNKDEKAGMELFYGKASCVDCHSGKFQTDQKFHAIAMPQLGPGKGDGNDGAYWRASGYRGFLEDFGRGRVTKRSDDNYKFRTPTLRNVAVTGPWGHAGAYKDLEAVVRHHLDPESCLQEFVPTASTLPPLDGVLELTSKHASFEQRFLTGARLEGFLLRDTFVHTNDLLRGRITSANELGSKALGDLEVNQLVAFLNALTDPRIHDLAHLIPERVPSGLPVED